MFRSLLRSTAERRRCCLQSLLKEIDGEHRNLVKKGWEQNYLDAVRRPGFTTEVLRERESTVMVTSARAAAEAQSKGLQNDDMLAYIQNAVDGFKQSWQTSVTDDVNAVASSEFA